MGKSVAESKAEITYASEFFRWNAGAGAAEGYYKPAGNAASRVLVMRQPVGPCYMITPGTSRWRWGPEDWPRDRAGCTMVIKPAQLTLLDAQTRRASTGCGASRWRPQRHHELLLGGRVGADDFDPRLRKLTFTGSTEVGQKLIEQSAQGVLKTSMELGGRTFAVSRTPTSTTRSRGDIAKMRNARRGGARRRTASTSTRTSPRSSPRSSPSAWVRSRSGGASRMASTSGR